MDSEILISKVIQLKWGGSTIIQCAVSQSLEEITLVMKANATNTNKSFYFFLNSEVGRKEEKTSNISLLAIVCLFPWSMVHAQRISCLLCLKCVSPTARRIWVKITHKICIYCSTKFWENKYWLTVFVKPICPAQYFYTTTCLCSYIWWVTELL